MNILGFKEHGIKILITVRQNTPIVMYHYTGKLIYHIIPLCRNEMNNEDHIILYLKCYLRQYFDLEKKVSKKISRNLLCAIKL